MAQVYFFPPVTLSSLPLPPGAATSANQVLEIAELTAIAGSTAASATAANQVTENASLSSIDGKLSALSRMAGSLTPVDFDETAISYVPSGNGAGQIGVVQFKKATVLVKTLTLSYDGSNRLTDVVAS